MTVVEVEQRYVTRHVKAVLLVALASLALVAGCGGSGASGSTSYEFDTGELESYISAEFVRMQHEANHVDTIVKFIDCNKPSENEAQCVVDATGFEPYGSLADPDPTTRFNVEVRCSDSKVDDCVLVRAERVD